MSHLRSGGAEREANFQGLEMPSLRLTDRFVATAAAPHGERLEAFDTQAPGLVLRVSDSGRKTWVVRYRSEDGRMPRFTLGTYPALTLADARDRAIDVCRAARQGEDPAAQKRHAKLLRPDDRPKTFRQLTDAYFIACERGEWTPKGKPQRARTLADSRAVMKRYVEPILGDLDLRDIGRPLVKKLLRDMAARGIGAQTKRTQAFIRGVYAWAIAEFEDDIVAINPATGFSPVGRINARLRAYTDEELARLWTGLARPDLLPAPEGSGRAAVGVSRQMALIIQLAALLLQRKSEVAGMRDGELDLARGLWRIPPERMKGGWPHVVPLSPQAVVLIRKAQALRNVVRDPRGERSAAELAQRPLFPSRSNPDVPVRGDSVTHAMRAVCASLKLEDATVHDLRRTGSTYMTSERLGISPFIRSKVLGHRGDTGGGAAVSVLHYDANEYLGEKRRALQAWANLLEEIVGIRTVAVEDAA